ncbi:SDR family NAD(P)-dependent oxidoreductase [uncultured Albimonas sp.]|uniref:SDR family NAD(P)-dependent oxidoreductase n=1 Tax=uncultured Albimonas sp. TaxID=1331701 RepID=UPI0030EB6381
MTDAASDARGPDRRPALILGAGSDMGREVARLLAAKGRPIQLAGRRPEALERDAADLRARFDVAVSTHAWDATDLASAGAFLDGLPETPSIVLCAVGLLGEQEAIQDDPAAIAQIVATNFTGPAVTLEAAAARLAKLPGRTAVVGIGSVAGDRGRARNYWYGAAKAGFATMLSGLRQRYAATDLTVTLVRPGFVATSMTAGMDLPKPLVISAEQQAKLIVEGVEKRRHHVIHWKWALLMSVIRNLPEAVFLKTRF